MKHLNSIKNQKGFTLIEVILVFVIAGIVGAMLIPYMGTALTRSGEPVTRLKTSLALDEVMENITGDYKNGTLIANLKNKIGNEGAAMTNNYGAYTVVKNRYIDFVGRAEDGAYGVNNPASGVLKVTIKTSAGEKLTALYL